MMSLKIFLFPGWAVPMELYKAQHIPKSEVFDYGFFGRTSCGMSLPSSAPGHFADSLIIAHSMGCAEALKVASEVHSVKGLVLFNPFIKFVSSDDFKGGWEQHEIDVMKRNLSSNPLSTLKIFYRNCAAPEKFEVRISAEINKQALEQGLDYLAASDCRPFLSQVRCPCLLICSDMDRIVRQPMSEGMERLLASSSLLRVAQAGHMLPLTGGSYWNSAVYEFIKGISGK